MVNQSQTIQDQNKEYQDFYYEYTGDIKRYCIITTQRTKQA